MTKEAEHKDEAVVMSNHSNHFFDLSIPKINLSNKSKKLISYGLLILASIVYFYFANLPKINPIDAAQAVILDGGKYSTATAILDKQIAKTKKKDDLVQLYLVRSSIADDTYNTRDAIKYATMAEDLDHSTLTSSTLAVEYRNLGDKTLAIKWYKTAIDRMNKNTQDYQGAVDDIQTKIKALSQ